MSAHSLVYRGITGTVEYSKVRSRAEGKFYFCGEWIDYSASDVRSLGEAFKKEVDRTLDKPAKT